MALESGTYIKDLVDTNPPGTDAISQGDDHIRLIKSVLQNSFPSTNNAPIIPDIAGNGLKYLQVNSGATATQWASIRQRGYINRSTFKYSSTTNILIGAGEYEVDDGSAPENYYWDSEITFTIGSGGSNASSSAAGTSQWQYLYIDESAISASPLVAGSFLNSTTAPTYSQTKHGWYNGSDRCIFAFYIISSGEITPFYHSGDTFVQYKTDQSEDADNTSSGTYAVLAPQIGTGTEIFGEVTIKLVSPNGNTNGSAFYAASFAGTGQFIGKVEAGDGSYDDEHVASNKRIATYDSGSARYIYITKSGGAAANYWTAFTNGWYLPNGM